MIVYKSIVGIDYSITSPGVCVFDISAKDFKFANCKFYYSTEKLSAAHRGANITGHFAPECQCPEQRFDQLSEWAIKLFASNSLVGIEGYSYSSFGLNFSVGENLGLLKYKLWKRGIYSGNYPVTVNPASLKKFATGKGNATKVDMFEAFKSADPDGYAMLNDVIPIKLKKIGVKKPKFEFSAPISDLIDAYFICKFMKETHFQVP